MIFLLLALGWREISAQDEACSSSGLHVLERWRLKRLLLSPGTNHYGIWGWKQKSCFLSTMQEKWWSFFFFFKVPQALSWEFRFWRLWSATHQSLYVVVKMRFFWSMFVAFLFMCRVCDHHRADCSDSYLTFQSFMPVSTWKINLWPFTYLFFFHPVTWFCIRSHVQELRRFITYHNLSSKISI